MAKDSADKESNEESPLLANDPTPVDTSQQDPSNVDDKNETDEDQEQEQGILETIVEDANALVEGVYEEIQEAAENIMEDLHEADDGDMYFLDMGLIRNMSILPGDIIEYTAAPEQALPTTQDPNDLKAGIKQDETTTTPPLSAYLLLLSAVLSLSSIGPLLELQHDVSSTLKVFWRMSGTAMVLLPLASIDIYHKGVPKLTTPQWLTFLLSDACYVVMVVGFVQALSFTAVGNAVILANSLSLILLVGKLCVGDPVTFLEGAGAMVAFAGAALCSKDSAENRSDTPGSGLFGDALAIMSAMGGVGYLIFAKTSRPHMPLSIFMFLIMAVGACITLLFAMFVLKETVTFDMNPNHGVGGFLVTQPDRLPLEVTMVVVCNLLGAMGYVRAMQYFDNLVIACVALLEPVAAELIASAFGVGQLPGWQGWLGNALVACGTLAVVYKSGKKGGDDVH
jgi:drug/metabolite transporter (DMT)-like permease